MEKYPYSADFRFGHDGCIMALLALMGVDSWGQSAGFEEVKNIWQTYEIPMASNLQFVFYKNKKGLVIFKLMLNERNLTLPFQPYSGVYYKWEDFKKHYLPVIESAKAKLNNLTGGKPVTVSGRVFCEELPLAGVQVSDGVEIVKTDSLGRYRMSSDKSQGFVFVIQPSGYTVKMKDGLLPDFYAELKKSKYEEETIDFELVRQNQDRYSVILATDIHLTNDSEKNDLSLFSKYAIPQIRSEYQRLAKEGAVYSVNLGDLSHELFWYSNDFGLEDAVAELKKNKWPAVLYSVSGNHDNDGAVSTSDTDRDAEHIYRKVLGPEYYSLNIGKEHWIMMDNIIYRNIPGKGKKAKGIVGDRSYDIGFTKDEMRWLENDLKYLDDEAQIHLCVHSPILSDNKSGTTLRPSQMDSLTKLFDRFKGVEIHCGHIHRTQYNVSEKYHVFTQRAVSALSGDMWTSSPDPLLSGDGEDAGVIVGRFTRDTSYYDYLTHRYGYKSMRIYDMNKVASWYDNEAVRNHLKMYPDHLDYSSKHYRNMIYVNYWMYREGEKVEIWEDGKLIDTQKVMDEDPLWYINHHIAIFNKKPVYNKKYSKDENNHIFRAKARKRKSEIVVRVKTEDGRLIQEEKLVR